MRRRSEIAAVAVLGSGAAVGAGFAPAGTLAATLLGIPLVLLLPGYSVVAAALPSWRPRPGELLLTAVGLSLVLSILAGFILDAAPGGLERRNWVVLLGVLTVAAAAVALGRIGRGRPPLEGLPSLDTERPPLDLRTVTRGAIAAGGLILAAGAAVAAIKISYEGAADQRAPEFTELAADRISARQTFVTVANHAAAERRYVIEARTSRGTILRRRLTLGPNGAKTLIIEPPKRANRVRVLLYRAERPSRPYRELTVLTKPPQSS